MNGNVIQTLEFDPRLEPWLADHAVDGTVILPATAMLNWVMTTLGDAACSLTEVSFSQAVFLPAPLTLTVSAERRWTIAGPEGTHASGGAEPGARPGEPLSVEVAQRALAPEDSQAFYTRLASHGVPYGPAFRGIRKLWRKGGEALAEIALPPGVQAGAFRFHPALFDACLHTLVATWSEVTAFLPVRVARAVLLSSAPISGILYSHAVARGEETDVRIHDSLGSQIARLEGIAVKRFPGGMRIERNSAQAPDFEVEPWLRGLIAGALRQPVEKINPDVSLIRLGLDSMMAVTLRNSIAEKLGVDLPMPRLLGGPSLRELVGIIATAPPAVPEE